MPEDTPTKPVANRDPVSDPSAEDLPSAGQASVPRDPPPPDAQSVCLRQTPRQATSAVAHIAPPPAPDDPMLAFEPVPYARPRANSITPDLQRAFIATLAATGIATWRAAIPPFHTPFQGYTPLLSQGDFFLR